MTGERAFIDWLRQRTAATSRVVLGPGDDTAAFAWSEGPPCLITTDMLLEGSCFTLIDSPIQVPGVEPASPRRVGRKAMAVNLSDIAAMAGRPLAAVISVGLPRRRGTDLARELYLGLKERADEFGVAIVGGDTNSWDGPLTINVTLIGEPGPMGIITRSGAQVGDWLFVTGPLGGSIHGHHLDFVPRVHEAWELATFGGLKAMMDISDGLALDLSRLCAESRCGAVVRGEAVPCQSGMSLLQALGDGEDFELLFAVDPITGQRLFAEQPVKGIRLYPIGEMVESGLWLETDGQRVTLPGVGYEHGWEE